MFGVGTGLFSVLYNTALLRVTEFHDHQKLAPAPLKSLLPFLLGGVLLYVYPQVLVGLGYSIADLGGLTPDGPLLPGSVALLLFVKITFSISNFASGVPGGLPMPMSVAGNMVGAVGGTLLIGNGFSAESQLPAYLVFGMASPFSGVVRAPFTSTALVVEMFGVSQCLPEIVTVASISTVVANGVGSPPAYDSLKRRILVNKNASSKTE